MRSTSAIISTILFFFGLQSLSAQIADPVKWKYSYKETMGNKIELVFEAAIVNGYSMYGVYFADGGPVRTSFSFDPSEKFSLTGKIVETTAPKQKNDPFFDNMLITTHSKKAVFKQVVSRKHSGSFEITGTVEYMACTGESCLPPVQKDFKFSIKPAIAKSNADNDSITQTANAENADSVELAIAPGNPKDEGSKVEAQPDTKTNQSSGLLGFFLLALLAGLAGTLTPCVFPMIPMTVSFFMRGADNRANAIFKGVVFGFAIMAIYTLIGLLVSLTSIGAGFANQLTVHWLPNTLFFLLFVVFAASFLGMFEMVLPGSIVNRADANVDKGGITGTLFMALVTVLVSFSCTGPIVGALLVEAAGGLALKPILGMFGFGLAFALPFTFFAIFPTAMKSLPKSGGWLNAVKVVLGIIMLAFSFKFIVNIDQSYHLGLLSREVFLAIWIALCIMLFLYLIGAIRFAHDSAMPHLSVPRFAMATIALIFAIYLATGLGSSPLNSISALLPPSGKKSSNLPALQAINRQNICDAPKFGDIFTLPYGLNGYFDYQQALNCADQIKKPVLIDFKGHSCSNCKKMEAAVWSDPEIQKFLSENFVIVALYTDDRTNLPENEWITQNGKKLKTIGQQNAQLQIEKYRSNALPLYVITDANGNELLPPTGTELDVKKYLEFLKKGKEMFEKKHKME